MATTAAATSVTATAANGLYTDTSGTSKTAASTAADQQDRFLKLLVAQLNNQDPLNPVDNAQMTSQLAQINTVQGISQLNDSIKAMSAQFGASQVLQASTLVGHTVLVNDNQLALDANKASGSFDLVGNADNVSVQVLTPGGSLIDTVQLGAQSSGRHDFNWDASKYTGSGNPVFKVNATAGATAISATPLSRATVVSVGSNNGALTVQLKGRPDAAYSDLKAIL